MNDTSDEIIKKQRDIFFKKTSNERFEIGCNFILMGRTIVESSIKEANPDISENELKIEVFKRYYKNTFPKNEMNNIINAMKQYFSNYKKYNIVAEPEPEYKLNKDK